jgi:hypothetical protein
MAFNFLTLSKMEMTVSMAEGLKILERDHFCCRYCGLDGRSSLENALILSVDFVVPRAHGGKKNPANLVTCCRPCKRIRGTRVCQNFEEARKYVLVRRRALLQAWESELLQPAGQVPPSEVETALCAGL